MDRIDALLDIYLESGDFPADATEAECEEVAALAASAGMVRASAAAIDSEARASMPEARARFERFVVASRPSAPPVRVVQPRRGLFGLRLLTVPRMLGLATALAVLIIVAGLTGSRLTSGPETVEALEVGDYVEMPGVVTAAEGAGDDRVITVSGPLGDIVVEASTETSIVQSEASADIATLQPGAQVVVAGTVLASRRIAAQTVAVGDPSQPATEPLTLKRLRELKPNLAGTVVVLALSPDDARARVVLNVPGDRYARSSIAVSRSRTPLACSRRRRRRRDQRSHRDPPDARWAKVSRHPARGPYPPRRKWSHRRPAAVRGCARPPGCRPWRDRCGYGRSNRRYRPHRTKGGTAPPESLGRGHGGVSLRAGCVHIPLPVSAQVQRHITEAKRL